MKKDLFHIFLYQQDILWEDPQGNCRKVESVLDKAFGGQQADIVVMPETFTTGFGDHMARQAEAPEGPTFDFVRRLAQRYDTLVAATWTVREQGVVYNRMHLVRPDGSYDVYDKAHTFRMSSEASQLGRGSRRPIVEWRGWHIRPAICYDLRFPLWLRNSEDFNYDLLLVCANWPGSRHEAWSTLLKARAIENLSYVAGCNRVGRDGTGIDYAGCSMVADYKGFSMTQAEPSPDPCNPLETVLHATLQAESLERFRNHWPFNLDFDPFELTNQ